VPEMLYFQRLVDPPPKKETVCERIENSKKIFFVSETNTWYETFRQKRITKNFVFRGWLTHQKKQKNLDFRERLTNLDPCEIKNVLLYAVCE